MSLLDAATDYLTPEHTRGVLLLLRSAFFLVCGAFLLRLLFSPVHGARVRERRVGLLLFLIFLGFLGIYAYQATWQLGGFLNPRFVLFMERYNPRRENAAGNLVRGRILGRTGPVDPGTFETEWCELAVSDPAVRGFRSYPVGAPTAHIVGYRHPLYGMMGMERAADAVVCGYMAELKTKEDFVEVGKTALQQKRLVGNDIHLTLSTDLQRLAWQLFRDRKGAAVGIDPRDGSIRLLATSPSFDPNEFDSKWNRDPNLPLLNRSVQGRYPAGSTFKLAIAALAIDQHKAGTLACPAGGYYAPGARKAIHDHEFYEYGPSWPGFGSLDIHKAFAKSSNTYFAQAGVLSGPAAFNRLAEDLCINDSIVLYESPSSNRIASARGNVPVLGTGKASLRELSQLSIGQGRLLVTPLHVAMLGASIAADGALWRPRIVETDPPRLLSIPIEVETARRVRGLMREAVTSGTGRGADVPGLHVGGKTGTAQNPHGKSHGWFVCLAPVEAPELVLAVVVENSGYGSQTAVPIAAELLKKAAELGYVTRAAEAGGTK